MRVWQGIIALPGPGDEGMACKGKDGSGSVNRAVVGGRSQKPHFGLG